VDIRVRIIGHQASEKCPHWTISPLTADFYGQPLIEKRRIYDLVYLPDGRLTENVFKRVSSNSNLNPNPNFKAQKRFLGNEMTSFFGQVSRYGKEKTERHELLSAWDMSAKLAANGIRTHARTNQRRTHAHTNQRRTHARTNQRRTHARTNQRRTLDRGHGDP